MPVVPPSSRMRSPGWMIDQLMLLSSFQAVSQVVPSALLPFLET
jgi:hypothetical protein